MEASISKKETTLRLTSRLVPMSSLLNISASQKDEVARLLAKGPAQARGIDIPLALKDIAARERKGLPFFCAGRHRVAVAYTVTGACKQPLAAIGTIPKRIFGLKQTMGQGIGKSRGHV